MLPGKRFTFRAFHGNAIAACGSNRVPVFGLQGLEQISPERRGEAAQRRPGLTCRWRFGPKCT
jgi:hypothetical protein